MERRASCNCGQVSITTKGEPLRVSVCHCIACQKRTGSAFGVQARFNVDHTKISGETKIYQRTGESGGVIDFHFCPQCGATVYFSTVSMPDVIAIPVGNFACLTFNTVPQLGSQGDHKSAAQTFPHPSVSVYQVRALPWVSLSGINDVYD
ncbi:GFA family protein [Shewanella sp. SR44-3]|uniref:GFA family protein n=1 Tax=Shewanella sp. SR44-3 TaxID=2760936 RepID=UPI0015FA70A1|nr:GFA family protein [Shewanella sp. SR44-3]MBB1270227.1 GFA family protein [Shewanella sp. SR44-3]